MLPIFCLRLACGLAASLLLLSPAQVMPRFYRVQFLIILGLMVTALVFVSGTADSLLWTALLLGAVVAFAGSFVWSLEGAPLGRTMIALNVLLPGFALALLAREPIVSDHARLAGQPSVIWRLVEDGTSAALLGTATSAMLMGHSYLVAPAMSITPLLRLLAGLFAAVLLRMIVAGVVLWSWTAGRASLTLDSDAVLWLPLRWGLGFVLPLILGWMAWQSARIRSTQSATGILYVVVVFCFLGELTGQLLQQGGFLL
ncbi:MAG: hypothetical protein K2R98_02010 [Gemmataceae bacterium]|nr:hypothetical protein [Gemmataceae bacterium]